MTHAELVERARRWLYNTLNCGVVVTELVAYTPSGETPDAIGWVWNKSILVECKTNRGDFFADRKKRSRQEGFRALGHWRFYLTPAGLISPEEIPDGWGLYEAHSNKIAHKAGVKYTNAYPKLPPFESDRASEVALLLSMLRRRKEVQACGLKEDENN